MQYISNKCMKIVKNIKHYIILKHKVSVIKFSICTILLGTFLICITPCQLKYSSDKISETGHFDWFLDFKENEFFSLNIKEYKKTRTSCISLEISK